MSLQAILLNLSSNKNWKKEMNFPNSWIYNAAIYYWESKENKHNITFTNIKTKEVSKIKLRISDKDLLESL